MSDDLSDLFRKKALEKLGIIDDDGEKPQEECDFFRELCSDKIDYNESSESINNHEKFISSVDQLSCQFPFLQYDRFIESFVTGIYAKVFISSCHFSSYSDFKKCCKIFGLSNKNRMKSVTYSLRDFTKRQNLKRMTQKYDEIINECQYFENELEQLYNYNFARAVLLLYMLDEKIDMENIDEDIEEINHNDVLKFNDSEIRDKYLIQWPTDDESYIKKIVELIKKRKNDFLSDFQQKNIIKFEDNKYNFDLKYRDVEHSIKKIISDSTDGISYSKLVTELRKMHPIIAFIPNYDLITKSLDSFEISGFIKSVRFGNYGIASNTYYSIANYSLENSQRVQGRKFFGRKNDDPYRFIEDLQYLDKGDFDDEEDQVTRIAGLVLAGRQDLISPTDEHDEFDFAVDMRNFSPTKEEMEIIQKINFVLNPDSKSCHVKVMIDKEIEVQYVESLQSILSKDEQLVIISFEKISEKVLKSLPNDHSIQIMGKDAIKLWLDITPILPSRKGAVCRIMDGSYQGKIGKLERTNYETGNADVELIPSGEEITTSIGNLQEINLRDDPIVDDFTIMSENYYEFLKNISSDTDGELFQRGIFTGDDFCSMLFINNQIDNWSKFEKDVNLHITCPKKYFDNGQSITYQKGMIEINPAGRNFDEMFLCQCNYFKNEKKICSHLIPILNELGIRNNCFSERNWRDEENVLFWMLNKIKS